MNNIYGLSLSDMEKIFLDNNSRKFHGKQLFTWLYQKRVTDYSLITDIKKICLILLRKIIVLKD